MTTCKKTSADLQLNHKRSRRKKDESKQYLEVMDMELRSQEVRTLAPENDPLKMGMGWKVDDLAKPQIMVESTFGDSHPGSAHLDQFVKEAVQAVNENGGKAARYFATDMCDGIAQGHDGINYSLPHRDAIVNLVEAQANASVYDGGVFIASCDKSVPAMLMSIGRLKDMSAIVVTGGVMEAHTLPKEYVVSDPACAINELLTLEQIGKFDAWEKTGVIPNSQLDYYKHNACPSCGACSFMGTASTMQIMAEALGLMLPGTALMAGMPLSDIIGSVNEGIGNTLKGIALLVGLGSMFGAILEESGGAQTLAVTMVRKFGDEKAAWALGITGLVVAMPVFFDAGLIILIPLAFSLAKRTKRSVLYYVIPLLAGLAVGHAFIPPTPGPVLVATMLGVDLGWVILIGIFCGKKYMIEVPEHVAQQADIDESKLPKFGTIVGIIVGIIMIPLLLIIANSVANASLPLVLVAFIVAALVRISVGSSTVAMTMAAGIISAMPGISALSPLYLACVTAAIAGGSTVCSHFNDSGFWLVKSLVGMDEKTTLKT